MNRDQVLEKLARGRDKWFVAFEDALPSWAIVEGLFLAVECGRVTIFNSKKKDFGEDITEQDWLGRRRQLGLTDPLVTGKPEEWPEEERIDAIGQNGHHPEVYAAKTDPSRSDGSTASYYELPKGCTELQDLISYRNLNAQDGEIFRAIYRKGRASHSDELRDAKKVLFYAQAEVERLEKLKVSP